MFWSENPIMRSLHKDEKNLTASDRWHLKQLLSLLPWCQKAVADSLQIDNRSLLRRFQPARLPTNRTPPYFWGLDPEKSQACVQPAAGYSEARAAIASGSAQDLDRLATYGVECLNSAFEELDRPQQTTKRVLIDLTLSNDLKAWRQSQFEAGRVLPSKGYGLKRASDEALQHLGIKDWPSCLLTTGALFGSGMFNFLIGAPDAEALYSNYCTDMIFFYDHGYHKIFPEFETLLEQSYADLHAKQTVSGLKRREAATIVQKFVKAKIALEEKHCASLANKTMKMDRHDALVLFFCESSIWGGAADSIARGHDAAAAMHDYVFSCPATDIVDVGSDLLNSEVVNGLLCTADVTDGGVVTAEALRRVHDAYAACGARMATERWAEPGAVMNGCLYAWHIYNERHRFLRRVVLGYPKARTQCAGGQREADFGEAFDAEFRTTGFSRPLRNACDGGDPCDHVRARIEGSEQRGLLAELWWLLATGVVEYARAGVVSEEVEDDMAERLRVGVAKAVSLGLMDDISWLFCHASHHAWQVNRLFEMAMFGSLLDDGGLQGKLDRGGY
jgi:hypothetical protein